MSDEIIRLPINLISESPTNPRRHYDAAGLQELADSIRANGVAQPVLVRPTDNSYQLVFGHRRFRAAKLAGEDFIPAMCRQLSNEEAAQLQLVENLQRADVTAVEEAEGFAALVRNHGVSPDELAARVGKSRTYVYNRLKLASATPEVLSAVSDGRLTPEVATLIARVPPPLQQQAIEQVQQPVLDDDLQPAGTQCASYREARRRLAQGFTVALVEAPWGMDSICATTQRACQTCPARSDNDPALLEAVGAGVCTDKLCYTQRGEAHVEQLVQAALASGRRVLEGDEARRIFPRHSMSWLMDDWEFCRVQTNFDATWAELMAQMGDAAPRPALLVDPHQPGITHDVIDAEDREQIEAWAREHLQLGDDDELERSQPTADSDEPPEIGQALDYYRWLRARKLMLTGLVERERTTDELRLIVETLISFGLGDDEARALSELADVPVTSAKGECNDAHLLGALPTLSADVLGRLATGLALWNVINTHAWGEDRRPNAERRIALARQYGVDLLHPDGPTRIETESPPPSAARAPKDVGRARREAPAARAAAGAVEADADDADAERDTRTLPLPLDWPAAQEVMDEAAAPPVGRD